MGNGVMTMMFEQTKLMRGLLLASAASALMALSACGDNMRKELGLEGNGGPDEFTVVRRAPLQTPASYQALPEPKPGATSLVEPDPIREARQAILGAGGAEQAGLSPAEAALLESAGAAQADDSVRQTLVEDQPKAELILDQLLGRTGADREQLNPAEETERLVEQGILQRPGDAVPAELRN
ncbi:MAG: DUF3035 domain-containing protein [Neomegalonema sp.]|nr:DUF3035 domain-containing protein [Neomegalonema sp.]